MTSAPRGWTAIDAVVLPEAHEAIEYGMMEAGALGTERTDTAAQAIVRGYFDRVPELESVRTSLYDALKLYDLSADRLLDLEVLEIADRDWLAEWKASWQPSEVGRFIIAPPWTEIENDGEHLVIRIEPGMAFGTGTHETTRLCLKAIEKYFRGNSFLDVGTGTGVLAIAAARLIPDARIEAVDSDSSAIEIARENAAINLVGERIDFAVGTVDQQTPSADFVCANLTAPVILDLLPALLGAACARLVLSGIFISQLDLIQSRLLELGVVECEIDQDGEWIALVV
jgi:ribosomal protein L11 methyltransferase